MLVGMLCGSETIDFLAACCIVVAFLCWAGEGV